jgi:hypothetical protein
MQEAEEKHEKSLKSEPKIELKSGKMTSKNRSRKLMRKGGGGVTPRTPSLSSKNPPDRIYPRKKTNIRSGPVGARGVFNWKLAFPIYYISIILVFFVRYILSGGFLDVKLGGCGVTPPTAQTPFFASIFAIDFWRSFFRILAQFLDHSFDEFSYIGSLFSSMFFVSIFH